MKFREKPIHVGGDGRTRLGRIDRHSYLLCIDKVCQTTDEQCRHYHFENHMFIHRLPRVGEHFHFVLLPISVILHSRVWQDSLFEEAA
jgi:hypothetical protein